MVPIRKSELLLLGALLLLTACGRPAAPTPIEVPTPPAGGPTSGGTTPPTERPSTGPETPSEMGRIALPQGKRASFSIPFYGRSVNVTASLGPKELSISGLSEAAITLANPFGEAAEATLHPFRVAGEPHLLITLTNGRNVLVWVLASNAQGTTKALESRVDWGASVEGERVKLTHRQYRDDGGYTIVSDYYQFNPKSRLYEKAPA